MNHERTRFSRAREPDILAGKHESRDFCEHEFISSFPREVFCPLFLQKASENGPIRICVLIAWDHALSLSTLYVFHHFFSSRAKEARKQKKKGKNITPDLRLVYWSIWGTWAFNLSMTLSIFLKVFRGSWVVKENESWGISVFNKMAVARWQWGGFQGQRFEF